MIPPPIQVGFAAVPSPNGHAKRAVTRPAKTSGYRPMWRGGVGIYPIRNPHRGFFLLRDVREMMLDGQVAFTVDLQSAPLHTVTIQVEAADPNVKSWVERQYKRLWESELSKVTPMGPYGSAGGEATWSVAEETGLIELEKLHDIYYLDRRPVTEGGQICGVNVHQVPHTNGVVELRQPGEWWWFTNESQFGDYWGTSSIRGCWYAWMEKSGYKGAIDCRRTFHFRWAYRGGQFYFPDESVIDANGVERNNRDVANELLDKMETGATLVLPGDRDEETHEREWEYKDAVVSADTAATSQYIKDLNMEILIGGKIPPEVVNAGESGAGYSGRAVPALVYWVSLDKKADSIVMQADEQLFKPMAKVNFGPHVSYTVKAMSLVPKPQEQGPGRPGQPGQAGAAGPQGQPAAPKAGGAMGQPNGALEQIAGQASDGGGVGMSMDASGHEHDKKGLFTGKGFVTEGRHLWAAVKSKAISEGLYPADHTKPVDTIYGPTGQSYHKVGEDSDHHYLFPSDSLGGYGIVKKFPKHVIQDAAEIYREGAKVSAKGDAYEHEGKIYGSKGGDGVVQKISWDKNAGQKMAHIKHNAGEVGVYPLRLLAKPGVHGAFASSSAKLSAEPSPADAIIDRAIAGGMTISDEVRRKVRSLVKKKVGGWQPGEFLKRLKAILNRYEPLLATVLSDAMLASYLEGGWRIAQRVPRFPDFPPPRALTIPAPEEEPVVTFPQLDHAAQFLNSKRLLTAEEYRAADAETRQAGFAMAKVANLDALEKIQAALVADVSDGGTLAQFRAVVDEALGKSAISKWQVERTYRDEIGQAMKDGQRRILTHKLVADEFPFVAYEGIHDSRRRPEHAWFQTHGINGTNIYAANDPTILRFWAPWDWGCRCHCVPITAEDAAKRGVREPVWVEPPPFDVPPEFQRPVMMSAAWEQEKRDAGGKWTDGGAGQTLTEDQVSEIVRQSPNLKHNPKFADHGSWERYCSRFGIEGKFATGHVSVASLKKNIDSGWLRMSGGIRQEATDSKVQSGQLNTVVITHEPGRGGLVVDGNHSLLAAIERGDESVKVIIADKYKDMLLPSNPIKLGMIGDEWHGPTSPGEGWVNVGTGPHGGKVWKRGAQETTPPAGKADGVAGNVPHSESLPAESVHVKATATAKQIAQKAAAVGLWAKLGASGKWLKDKTRQVYTTLEGRYGRKQAIAIFAMGHVVGLGTPGFNLVPGSTLLAMAPFAAMAEIYLQASKALKKPVAMSETQPLELTQEQLEAAAHQLVSEIQGAWTEKTKGWK